MVPAMGTRYQTDVGGCTTVAGSNRTADASPATATAAMRSSAPCSVRFQAAWKKAATRTRVRATPSTGGKGCPPGAGAKKRMAPGVGETLARTAAGEHRPGE